MVVASLFSAFHAFRSFKALVLGDFLLDTYTTGRVKRISPEAPVQVLEVLAQESRAGGAGNAALNLIALGGSVFVMGRVGKDPEGALLTETLQKQGVDVQFLFVEGGYRTPIKNRLIADSQQLLRIDMEKVVRVGEEIEMRAIAMLHEIIPSVQVVAISDYGKGFLTDRLIQAAIGIAKQAGVSCIVDPKGSDFTKYRGVNVLKPNLSEAYAAAKLSHSTSLDRVAEVLVKNVEVDQLLITRSEAGMSLFEAGGKRRDFPVRVREVKDVTGAGDTVLAMVSLGMAHGIDLSIAVQLANIAAGIAIEKIGCATIRLSEVAERLLEIDFESKVFQEHHIFVLQQVLKKGCYTLLVVDRSDIISGHLLQTIRELAKERDLVLYIRNAELQDRFVHVLSSIHDIKAIVLQKENLERLCKLVPPQEVFFFEEAYSSSIRPPPRQTASL